MTIKELYNKELRRIQTFIGYLERSGVQVNFKIPKTPKTITEGSVRRLAKITKDVILANSEITELETGEVRTGRAILGTIQKKKDGKVSVDDVSTGEILQDKKRRDQLKHPIRELTVDVIDDIPERDRIILDNATSEILDNVVDWLSEPVENPKWTKWYTDKRQELADKLKSAINETINRNGYESTARVVENNASAFRDAIEAIHYYKDETGSIDSISMQIDNLIGILFGAISMGDAIELSDYQYHE